MNMGFGDREWMCESNFCTKNDGWKVLREGEETATLMSLEKAYNRGAWKVCGVSWGSMGITMQGAKLFSTNNQM